MKGNLAHGADYLVRGAKLLRHPDLRKYVLVPLTVNILIFASLRKSRLILRGCVSSFCLA